MSEPVISVNGKVEDVMSFFRVSRSTVMAWKSESPPRIGFWIEGRNLMFGEEDVVSLKAAGYVASRRLQPGEAKDIARREWREHLNVRHADMVLRELAKVKDRLESVEARLLEKAA